MTTPSGAPTTSFLKTETKANVSSTYTATAPPLIDRKPTPVPLPIVSSSSDPPTGTSALIPTSTPDDPHRPSKFGQNQFTHSNSR